MLLKLSSVMCAPLIAGGDLLGLLYLGNDRVASLFDPRALEPHHDLRRASRVDSAERVAAGTLCAPNNAELEKRLKGQKFGEIIGSVASMLDVYRKVQKVAPTDISVLISGETGTGKELIAREIHNSQPACDRAVHRDQLRRDPRESDGERAVSATWRGAFTARSQPGGQSSSRANGGTLFLDEIGELPLALQVKLLRAPAGTRRHEIGDGKPEKVDIRRDCSEPIEISTKRSRRAGSARICSTD